jgi:hypothetical protein
MDHGAPIWKAAELNELMRRVGDASLGFAPSGEIIRIDMAVWHLVVRQPMQQTPQKANRARVPISFVRMSSALRRR